MEKEQLPYADFVVTARKYKTLLTAKYINRPLWQKRPPGDVSSALPGTVTRIAVASGQEIAEGDLLVILEAMKMLNRIVSPVAGTVREICVKEGDKIGKHHLMVRIETK
ncbi:MAG: acetyl-CoA carboxylase biotin carboxyl carrier protein subunit [Tannerellaceae bacterium]|nr:acetyl-CoA carboxylase biotin carboxyl carrier protein subunit [Tannerellaceae bacterium]